MITIFCDFCQFAAKNGVFLKNECYDPFFHNTGSFVLSKNRHFFGENIFKIITSVPGGESISRPIYPQAETRPLCHTFTAFFFFFFFFLSLHSSALFSSDTRSNSSEKGSLLNRVTRLGEFSPLGQLFTLSSFSKITEVAQTFGLLFPR
jgi:hypothetical protein